VAALRAGLRQNGGLILLTGPAGSGKTTTIYACLTELAESGGQHVITVEDPAERIIAGIMQTEVSEARGLNFATAARHLLRQDPQVLVIGEIRDDETASLAVRAALTGHLVISTLHAGSVRGVFERLLVMCPDHYAVVSSVSLVLNQRLVRRLCAGCHGAGCEACLGTGYRGRLPLVEWISMEDRLRSELRSKGVEAVHVEANLRTAGAALVARGVTDAREIERILG
jgi:type II secretory ATPase GspE/PulE/Tfp pilus assembly ATPase PilB-like protein